MARYSILSAAKLLGISRETLRRWERQRVIPKAPRLRRTGERIYSDELIAEIRKRTDETMPADEWEKQSRKSRR